MPFKDFDEDGIFKLLADCMFSWLTEVPTRPVQHDREANMDLATPFENASHVALVDR